MKDKKGSIGLVAIIIGLTLAVILAANLVIPIVRQSTQSQLHTENLVNTGADTLTVTYTDMVDASLSITGLTVTDNYTIDYATGSVEFTNSAAATYSATYGYYTASYTSMTTVERSLLAIVILAVIMGLLYAVFSGFGLIGKN